jgi:gamma-glutamyltranspeptidase/glutathione hydrolase
MPLRPLLSLLLLLPLLSTLALAQSRRPPGTKAVNPDDHARWNATGQHGAIAAGGSEAVSVGIDMLKSGGNAFDAAAATLLALTVTDADNFCFGGEVPIIVYDAKRNVVEVICGMGTAPRLATREHFASKGDGHIPLTGLEPAAVPAAPDAIITLLDRYGTKTFADIAAPTLRILDRHEHPWHGNQAVTIRKMVDAEKAASGDRRRGLRLASDCFYRGPIARDLDAWCKANGGLLRYSDLATFSTRIEDPVSITYRGHTIYKCGPWTQGPWLLEALSLLEGFDLKAAGPGSPDTIHLTTEAMKLALADRDWHYADPLFEDVPLTQLLSPDYADKRRTLIDPKRASLEQRPGDPRSGKPLLENPGTLPPGKAAAANDTTTCLVADAAGNVVAATPSGWDGVLAGDTGVWLNSRLQSFNTWPDHPNHIEPGKRPRITLTPTLVLKDGKPAMAVSVAGGDGQDQVTLQLLIDMIDFGMAPSDAVTAPRFGTNHFVGSFGQKPPVLGSLQANPTLGEAVINELKARGHRVTIQPRALSNPTALRIDPGTGAISAAGDPKAGRHAGAY